MDEIAQVGDLNVHDNFVSKTVARNSTSGNFSRTNLKQKTKEELQKMQNTISILVILHMALKTCLHLSPISDLV